MTDPKVIEALEALNNFCRCLFNNHGALSASIVVREKIDALLAAAAPVPAPAPVAPSLPWQPALSQAAMEINGLNRGDGEHGDYVRLDEVRDALSRMRDTLAAAPAAPVVPVKFDRLGRADGASWSADFYPDGAPPYATVTIHLRPGEDAGETTATMLSSVGRGP